jgi:tetratricopeptide repeat protein 21B
MPKYLDAAEKVCQRSKMAGLAFCKGLYLRYTNLPHLALKELNVARYDNQYGPLATATMIDIYLNPANEMIFTNIEDQKESHHTTVDNIKVARELI